MSLHSPALSKHRVCSLESTSSELNFSVRYQILVCDSVDIARSDPTEGDDGSYEANKVEELKSASPLRVDTAVLEYALSSSAVRKDENIRRRLGNYH